MENRNFRFSDFTNLSAYCSLQERFLKYDNRGRAYEKIDQPFENTKILHEVWAGAGFETNIIEKDYLKDFLLPGVTLIARNHSKSIRKYARDKGILTDDLREGLAKKELSNCNQAEQMITTADYITDSIRVLILNELNKFRDILNDLVINPFPNIQSKLQFSWSRTDVVYFIHLLRVNNQVESISDADLGRIIDSVFEAIKDGSYCSIDDSRKTLNDFKLTSGRPQGKALQRLQNLFMNEDFYNV